MMEAITFIPSRLRTLLYLVRSELLNIVLAVATVMSPWSLPIKVVALAAVLAFAVAWGPFRFLGAAVRILPEYLEYVERSGSVQRVRWSDVTHYNLSSFALRMLNATRELPVVFSRPLLIGKRVEFRRLLVQSCPSATSVGRLGWWRIMLRSIKN